MKTVNGQTIVGKGDIESSTGEVKVDNKTIFKNEDGELQLGVVNQKGDNNLTDVYIHVDESRNEYNYTRIEPYSLEMSYNLFDPEFGEESLKNVSITPFGFRYSSGDFDSSYIGMLVWPKHSGNFTSVLSVDDVFADEKGNIKTVSFVNQEQKGIDVTIFPKVEYMENNKIYISFDFNRTYLEFLYISIL